MNRNRARAYEALSLSWKSLGEIARSIDTKPPTVGYHLRVLESRGLVESRGRTKGAKWRRLVPKDGARVPCAELPQLPRLLALPRAWVSIHRGEKRDSLYRYIDEWIALGLAEKRKPPHGPKRGYQYRRLATSITFHDDQTMSFTSMNRTTTSKHQAKRDIDCQ